MTEPSSQLPPCTDYSAYSLNELWDMVSPPDTLSQAQIASWYEMAILCGDQADNLTRALARLADFWPPAPGSAASTFADLVRGVIASMSADASNARQMSQSLSGIVSELDAAKAQMQDLMDLQAHNQELPSAKSRPGQLSFFESSTQPVVEYAPVGWEDDLRAQAHTIMATTDAKIDVIAGAMPVFRPFVAAPFDDPGAGSGAGGLGDAEGQGSSAEVLQRAETLPPLRRPGLSTWIPHPIDEPLDRVSNMPVLAGVTSPPPWPEPMVPAQPSLGGGLPTDGVRMPRASEGEQAIPPATVVPLSYGSATLEPGASDPGNMNRQDASAGRAANGSSTLLPASGARPPSAPNRPSTRPGGRAALWYSQRKRKEADPTDPWAIRRGVPQVIEPSEPPEHDPGAGVIGLNS